jgi:hypothetical protein
VSIKLSFTAPTQSENFDLASQMLIIDEQKCEKNNEFSNILEKIKTNEHPITMQNTRNIDLN